MYDIYYYSRKKKLLKKNNINKMNNNIIKNSILSFLKDIQTNIENDELSESQLNSLTKIYLEYNFKNDNLEDKDIIEYMFLGWYIYKNLKM
jgi:hypothetical protein